MKKTITTSSEIITIWRHWPQFSIKFHIIVYYYYYHYYYFGVSSSGCDIITFIHMYKILNWMVEQLRCRRTCKSFNRINKWINRCIMYKIVIIIIVVKHTTFTIGWAHIYLKRLLILASVKLFCFLTAAATNKHDCIHHLKWVKCIVPN